MRYRFLVVMTIFLFFSCVNDDSAREYITQGNVHYDGLNTPITYADLYRVSVEQGGEVWALTLSQEYVSYGTTYTDALLYVEMFKPNGQPLEGVYDAFHPVRTLEFAEYFENLTLYDGVPQSYSLHIPYYKFVDGRVEVINRGNNFFHFEVSLLTQEGRLLNAFFDGRVQF